MRRVSTGNRYADLVLDGGFPANSINVIMGQPGSGKTIFAEQLAFANLDAERPVLYLTTISELGAAGTSPDRSGSKRRSRTVETSIALRAGAIVAVVASHVDLITLESVRLAAPEQARAAVAEARGLVEAAVAEYTAAQRGRSADAAITALRRHTLAAMDREMERVRARHGCTAAAEEVEFALRRMVNQFLHGPSVRARQLAAEGRLEEYERALEVLFEIEPPSAQPSRPADHACPARGQDDGDGAPRRARWGRRKSAPPSPKYPTQISTCASDGRGSQPSIAPRNLPTSLPTVSTWTLVRL